MFKGFEYMFKSFEYIFKSFEWNFNPTKKLFYQTSRLFNPVILKSPQEIQNFCKIAHYLCTRKQQKMTEMTMKPS